MRKTQSNLRTSRPAGKKYTIVHSEVCKTKFNRLKPFLSWEPSREEQFHSQMTLSYNKFSPMLRSRVFDLWCCQCSWWSCYTHDVGNNMTFRTENHHFIPDGEDVIDGHVDTSRTVYEVSYTLIHENILHFFNGMGARLGNGISPCFFTFLRGGVWQAFPKPFFFWENFLLLVYVSTVINPVFGFIRVPLVQLQGGTFVA